MLLPPSLGLFTRQLGARPFLLGDNTSLEPFTENLRYETEESKQYGLSGIYNNDRILNIVLAKRQDGLNLELAESASVGLYRVQIDARTDELVKQFDLDPDMLVNEERWELSYRTYDPEDLVVASAVVVGGVTYTTWCAVEVDGNLVDISSIMDYIKPRTTSNQVNRWIEEATTLSIKADSSPNKIHLDFRNYGDPRVDCKGELTYQGGGNRYLFTEDGQALEQKENKAPWDLDCGTFIEPGSRQLYSDFGLHDGNWQYTKQNVMTLENFQTFELFPQHRMLVHTVQAPSQEDTSWELVFDSVSWSPGKTTFSAFLEATLKDASHIKLQIGLRIYETTGAVRREVVRNIDDVDFGLRQINLPETTEPVGRISGFIRLLHLYPGDRVVVGTAMPQLEYSGTASSRCYGTRLPDQITYVPETVDYTMEYGRFRLAFFPGYQGIPGTFCGDQFLFDTRSNTGLNGWYLKHTSEGILRFGCVDETGLVHHWVDSASVVELPQDQVEITCWYGTFGFRLDINGNKTGFNHLVPSATPDMLSVVRLGRDYLEESYMTGEVSLFSWEPINDNME